MIFSTRRSFSRRLALPTVRPLPSTATDARRAGTAARVLALIGIASLAGLLAPSASIAQAPPKTDDEKAFYSIGSGMADQFKDLKPISERELELLLQGVRDGIQGNTLAVERQQGGGCLGLGAAEVVEARVRMAVESGGRLAVPHHVNLRHDSEPLF